MLVSHSMKHKLRVLSANSSSKHIDQSQCRDFTQEQTYTYLPQEQRLWDNDMNCSYNASLVLHFRTVKISEIKSYMSC